MPLRILQVGHREGGGGAQTVASYLLRAYRDRGHHSWLAVGSKESDDPDVLTIPNHASQSRWTRASFAAGTALKPLVGRVRGAGRMDNLLGNVSRAVGEPRRWLDIRLGREDFHYPGTWRLLDLAPQRPHVVHCHHLSSNYFDMNALPWLSHQVPVILNLHNAWPLSGHCSHSLQCDRWKTGCGRCPDLTIPTAVRRDATAFNWRRKRAIYNRSRLYITPDSHWNMDRVRVSMLRGAKYRVIHNAVDQSVFHPDDRTAARAELGLPHASEIVLFVATKPRSNVWKDYSTMETAVRRVADTNPDMDLLFVCVGEDADEMRSGRARIRFVGFQRDRERLAMYYRAADVYVHAARAENFGLTITEALASGIPVVATAIGGIPEQVRDGVTGFLTRPADPEMMAERIERLLRDDALRHEMGQRAADDASVRFRLDRQVEDFLEWYREVISDWEAWRRTGESHSAETPATIVF